MTTFKNLAIVVKQAKKVLQQKEQESEVQTSLHRAKFYEVETAKEVLQQAVDNLLEASDLEA